MSETRFTKGPWRADGPDPYGDWNILHSGDALAIAAVVENMRYQREVTANAHLIAAAPDLYKALEAERIADEADDAYLEILERADAEGWLNDPTGGLHVHEANVRAQTLRREARSMRETALSRARGESLEGK